MYIPDRGSAFTGEGEPFAGGEGEPFAGGEGDTFTDDEGNDITEQAVLPTETVKHNNIIFFIWQLSMDTLFELQL